MKEPTANADSQQMRPAESAAISIMRSLPTEPLRKDAIEWFRQMAKRDEIREHILRVLQTYVDDLTKR